jgi:hypothetical protein
MAPWRTSTLSQILYCRGRCASGVRSLWQSHSCSAIRHIDDGPPRTISGDQIPRGSHRTFSGVGGGKLDSLRVVSPNRLCAPRGALGADHPQQPIVVVSTVRGGGAPPGTGLTLVYRIGRSHRAAEFLLLV